jgi:hypothetical protein
VCALPARTHAGRPGSDWIVPDLDKLRRNRYATAAQSAGSGRSAASATHST